MENKTKNNDYLKIVCIYFTAIAMIIVTLLFAFAFPKSSEASVETIAYRQGDTGSVVKQIQSKLSQYGLYNGSIDGIYGTNTTKGVKAFQQKNGLPADGICGTKTAKALGINISEGSSNSGYSSSDQYVLAKCIYAEARGEPYIGMVAVGSVILNRVKHPDFPNTIAGVVYQPWAFTSVQDGQMSLEPDDTAHRAARDALNGWDPTNGCIYYYNPAVATSKWIWSRPIMLVIGKHNFAK